mgnify:CR=1 FL=1
MASWFVDVSNVEEWLTSLDQDSYRQTAEGKVMKAKRLSDLLNERPIDRAAVESHKKRMVDVIRAYRLREIRQALELTQVEVASRLQVSQNRVSRIEHGDVDKAQINTLRRYVEALGGTLRVEMEFGAESFPLV